MSLHSAPNSVLPLAVTRAEVYVQVAAALYAAHRTDPHPSSIEKDVGRTRESSRQVVDMIMAEVAEIEREDAAAAAEAAKKAKR